MRRTTNEMKERITIRQESREDCKKVFEVHRLAFAQDNEAKLVDALRKNPAAFVPELSIVAVEGDQVVGHILFTRIAIVGQQEYVSLALAPMAVLPDHQCAGIGGLLVRKGLETARAAGFRSVIVLGHEHYYPKFGFAPAERWQVKAPFEVPSAAFMAIELVPLGLKDVSGTVRYPQEFEGV